MLFSTGIKNEISTAYVYRIDLSIIIDDIKVILADFTFNCTSSDPLQELSDG